MSVNREEKISSIISEWIKTMNYLTGPNSLPMIQAVSKNTIDGISLKTIQDKVMNSQYKSLNEFIYEFEKLLQKEKDILNSVSSTDIAGVEDIDNINEETLANVFAVYKLFLLGEYLRNWADKTSKKVDSNTTTIDKLYVTIMRGKTNTNIGKQSRSKKLPEEKPQRSSKRLSAIQKKYDHDMEIEENSEDLLTPQPSSSQEFETIESSLPPTVDFDTTPKLSDSLGNDSVTDNTSTQKSLEIDPKRSLQQMELLSLEGSDKIPNKSISQSSGKTFGFEKDQLRGDQVLPEKAIVQISPMKKRRVENKEQMIHKKLRNDEIPQPCTSTTTPGTSHDYNTQIFEGNSENKNIPKKVNLPKRRKSRFLFGKARLKNRAKTLFNRKLKSENLMKQMAKPIESPKNNPNSIDLTLETSESSVESEAPLQISFATNYNNNNNNNNNNIYIDDDTEIQIPEQKQIFIADKESLNTTNSKSPEQISVKPIVLKTSPPMDPEAKPPRPTASVTFYNNFKPVPLHRETLHTRSVLHQNQFFPRYPYTAYPPVNPSPFYRFYSRQKVPTFTMFRQHYPQQRHEFTARHRPMN